MQKVDNFVVTEQGLIQKEEYDPDKHRLPTQEEIDLCKEWIGNFCKTGSMNPEAHSYSLKHEVERWTEKEITYVSNGAFISAALNLGYKAQALGNKITNTIFNMILLQPGWKRIRPIGFSKWLFDQKDQNTPIGDLAKEASKDETWPGRATKFIEFQLYLEINMRATSACLRTLKEAWIACYGEKPPHPDLKIYTNCDRFYDGECDTLEYGDSYPEAPNGKAYIYVLFEPSGNDGLLHVRYVGKTDKPAERLKQHITCPGSIEKVIWTSKLLEAGTYPRMGIIELVNEKETSLAEEIYILAFGEYERRPDQPITNVLFNKNLVTDIREYLP